MSIDLRVSTYAVRDIETKPFAHILRLTPKRLAERENRDGVVFPEDGPTYYMRVGEWLGDRHAKRLGMVRSSTVATAYRDSYGMPRLRFVWLMVPADAGINRQSLDLARKQGRRWFKVPTGGYATRP